MTWLQFALMTVFTWGVYGILLNQGRFRLSNGPTDHDASLKAFLWVGVAYFIVAIIGPAILLAMRGAKFTFKPDGIWWSLLAGSAGAVGAFTLILALGAAAAIYKGSASLVVMPIVFAGAPIVNSIVVMFMNPPKGGIPIPFIAGVLMAAMGAYLVATFSPLPAPPPGAKPAGAPAPHSTASAAVAPSAASVAAK